MSLKVLIVEDNPLNMELATDLLELAGFQTMRARTAEEGLHLAEALHPDIILMDLSLPGMDGMAALKALRATPRLSHLPVVALTAHAMKGDEEMAFSAGFDGYMKKPFDTRTFSERVAHFAHVRTPNS